MARLNISIPDELRESMAGLNCNWSAIAQEAFSHAVELEQLRGEGRDMEAGLARLRVDKHRRTEHEQAEGFQHGMTWALEEASYENLREAAALEQGSPDMARTWVNDKLDASALALPSLPRASVSSSYALGFLQAASGVLSKV